MPSCQEIHFETANMSERRHFLDSDVVVIRNAVRSVKRLVRMDLIVDATHPNDGRESEDLTGR
jgi:hypothetical protein